MEHHSPCQLGVISYIDDRVTFLTEINFETFLIDITDNRN